MRPSTDAWIAAAAAGAIAVLLAVSDAKLFEEAPESPLYRQTLEKAYDRFRESDAVVPAGGGAPAASAPASPAPSAQAHDHDGPHFLEGNRLAAEGRREEALAQLHAALAEHPGCPLALHRIGDILLEMGRPADSLSHYRGVLESKPDYFCVFEHMADAHLALGEAAEAEAMDARAVEGYLRQAAQGGSAGAGGRRSLARLYLRRGRSLPEAVSLAEGLAAEDPPDASHLDLLARCYEASGRPADALAAVERILALAPGLAPSYEAYRARLRAAAGKR